MMASRRKDFVIYHSENSNNTVSRLDAEDESVVVFLLLDDGFAQPGKGFAQMVHRLLDGLGVHLNQVDVFRIAGLRLQI